MYGYLMHRDPQLTCRSHQNLALTAPVCLQIMHKQQADEKRAALQEASAVDDMYEMLSVYEQKVPIGDQVKQTVLGHKSILRVIYHKPVQSSAMLTDVSQIFT